MCLPARLWQSVCEGIVVQLSCLWAVAAPVEAGAAGRAAAGSIRCAVGQRGHHARRHRGAGRAAVCDACEADCQVHLWRTITGRITNKLWCSAVVQSSSVMLAARCH